MYALKEKGKINITFMRGMCMQNMKLIERQIEELRHEMLELYEQVGSFTDQRIVKVSQELDQLLNHYT